MSLDGTDEYNGFFARTMALRYRQLVEELGAELEHAYGWKAKVARQLGVHPSYISKIANGEIDAVGYDIVARAMDRLSISRNYFGGREPTKGSYKDYLRERYVPERKDGNAVTNGMLGFKAIAAKSAGLLAYREEDWPTVQALAREVLNMPIVHFAREVAESTSYREGSGDGFQMLLHLFLSTISDDAGEALRVFSEKVNDIKARSAAHTEEPEPDDPKT